MKARIYNWILGKILRHLFHFVTPEEVIVRNKHGHLLLNGRHLTMEETSYVEGAAKQLLDSPLWSMLKKNIQFQANLKMFEKSGSTYDIISGKATLWSLQLIEEKLRELAR